MQIRKAAVFSNRAADWTKERISQLRKQEIEQLQANAGALAWYIEIFIAFPEG